MRHYCRRSFSFFIRLKKLFFIIYVNNLHLSGHVVPMILQYLLLYQHLQLSAQCTGQLHSQAEPRLSEQYSMQVNFLFLLLFDVYNQFGNLALTGNLKKCQSTQPSTLTLSNECKARKVNCGCVYFVYILKPVLFGGFYKQYQMHQCSFHGYQNRVSH